MSFDTASRHWGNSTCSSQTLRATARKSPIRTHRNLAAFVATFCVVFALSGCATAPPVEQKDPWLTAQEAHHQAFGDFDLPRKLGSIDNIGLQLPAVSPDGQKVLYLRTDQNFVSAMTLFGSDRPEDTPPGGLLSVWVRPVKGKDPGQRVSRGRWAHSPVWSPSGDAIAYVAQEGAYTSIVLRNLVSQQEEQMGIPKSINCLPRFDRDESTLIFCSGPNATAAFRVYRQTAGQSPAPLTPEGPDCVLPACVMDDGSVVCGQAQESVLNWVRCRSDALGQIVANVGDADRPAVLQAWAGLTDPVSPDRMSLLFYEPSGNRISVCDLKQQTVRRHRPGGISACWLTASTMALATPEALFCVNVLNGVSIQLMSGAWIPARYIAEERRLILLGKEGGVSRLALYEMNFRTPPAHPEEKH